MYIKGISTLYQKTYRHAIVAIAFGNVSNSEDIANGKHSVWQDSVGAIAPHIGRTGFGNPTVPGPPRRAWDSAPNL